MNNSLNKGLASIACALTLLLAGCLNSGGGGEDNAPVSAGATTATNEPATPTDPIVSGPSSNDPPSANPPAANPASPSGSSALTLQEALAAARKFLDERAAAFATDVPKTAEERYKDHDACYKGNGFTKEFLKQAFAEPTNLRSRASQAYTIGFTRDNLTVLAVRQMTNADGTTRNEIDVEYDQLNTKEGTSQRIQQVLVKGSTTGVCAAGHDSADLRILGNQRDFSVGFMAINQFQSDFLLATGAPASPPATSRRSLRYSVIDPQGKATYAVVSRQVAGRVWSLKLISPRLLASDPILAGKFGNYISGYEADDFFRICVNGSGSPVGATADCTLGTTVQDLGTTINTGFFDPDAALVTNGDNAFAALGLVAGETYKFEIFNDDGWKTANGHAGKTPIATYNENLERLPYTFAELLTGPGRLTRGAPVLSLSSAQIGAAFLDSIDTCLTFTNGGLSALPDARKFGRQAAFVFTQGPDAETIAPNFWPARRSVDYFFSPGPASAILDTVVTIPGKPANVRERTTGQTAQIYTDRDSAQLRFVINYRN